MKPTTEPGGRVSDKPQSADPRVTLLEPRESRHVSYLQLRELRYIRFALTVLALIGVVYSMYAASSVLVPVFLAFLIYLLLAPAVDAVSRHRVPRFLAALAALCLLCAPFVGAVYFLSEPAAQWMKMAPSSLAGIRLQVEELAAPLEPVKEASEAVEDVMSDLAGQMPGEQVVTVREPGLAETVIAESPFVIASLFVAVAVAFLLLMSGHRLVATLLSRSPRFSDRRNAYRAIEIMQRDASQYLGTILVINIILGFSCAAAFWALGLPNPMLWGAVAGCLNFAPYIGSAITFAVVTFVAAATFSEPSAIFAPGLAFLLLTVIEGQIITPMILGSRLSINPAAVVIAVIVFAALWGVAGALMALPLCIAGRAAYRHFVAQEDEQSE